MTFLVTGGGGFLGSNLVASLNALGHTDIKIYNWRQSAENSHNEETLTKSLEGVECVFHLAWTTVPQTAEENRRRDIHSNIVDGLKLLDACRKAGVRKVIFPSSGGTVYGESGGKILDESSPTDPICSYGVSKLAFEKYLQLYEHLYGLDYRILRITNAYGKGQRADRPQGLIGVALRKIKLDEPIRIWGDGHVVRDYIYIDDVISCCIRAATAKIPKNGQRIFNVSSQQGLSVREVLSAIEQVAGKKLDITYEPARSYDVERIVLSNRRAKEILGWSPQISFEEGLRKTWDWVSQND